MAFPWAAVAEGVATLGSAALANVKKRGSSRMMQVSKELAAYNTQLNEEVYNKYESPSAMMRQYKEAGLNPALIYGGASPGSVDAGQVSTNPSDYEDYRSNFAQQALQGLSSGLSAYQSFVGNQIANTNAAKAGRLMDEKITAEQLSNQLKEATNQYNIESLATDVESKRFSLAYNQVIKWQEGLNNLDMQIAQLEGQKIKNRKTKEEIRNLRKVRQEISAHIDLMNAQMDSINEELDFRRETKEDRKLGIKLGNYQTAVNTQNAGYLGKIYSNNASWNDTFNADKHYQNVYSGPALWNLPGAAIKTFDRWLTNLIYGRK